MARQVPIKLQELSVSVREKLLSTPDKTYAGDDFGVVLWGDYDSWCLVVLLSKCDNFIHTL